MSERVPPEVRPFETEQVEQWRQQLVERNVDPELPWPDREVMRLVGRFLATIDGLIAERDALAEDEQSWFEQDAARESRAGSGLDQPAAAPPPDEREGLVRAQSIIEGLLNGLGHAEGNGYLYAGLSHADHELRARVDPDGHLCGYKYGCPHREHAVRDAEPPAREECRNCRHGYAEHTGRSLREGRLQPADARPGSACEHLTDAHHTCPCPAFSPAREAQPARKPLDELLIPSGDLDYATRYGRGWNDAIRAVARLAEQDQQEEEPR